MERQVATQTESGGDGGTLDVPVPIPSVRREAVIAASPDEVWEALATDEGRERWLEEHPRREIHVEKEEPPARLVWWWSADDGMPTRVELLVSAVAHGSRVVVIESAPRFPVASLVASFAMVRA